MSDVRPRPSRVPRQGEQEASFQNCLTRAARRKVADHFAAELTAACGTFLGNSLQAM